MSWDTFHALIGDVGSDLTLAQMLLRAALVFLIGLAMIRFAPPRIFSRGTPIDIIVAIVIGSNLSRVLTGDAPFVETVAATALLLILHSLLTHWAARWRPLATLIKGRVHVIAENGEADLKRMRACAVGERDLMSAIRAAGGERIEDVKLATLERGGDIDVVFRERRGSC